MEENIENTWFSDGMYYTSHSCIICITRNMKGKQTPRLNTLCLYKSLIIASYGSVGCNCNSHFVSCASPGPSQANKRLPSTLYVLTYLSLLHHMHRLVAMQSLLYIITLFFKSFLVDQLVSTPPEKCKRTRGLNN